ncbi:MAG: trigger factor [Alphaproteobacteria bacterium]|nr:trigger factor [Alphaproteobacteria bacterium]
MKSQELKAQGLQKKYAVTVETAEFENKVDAKIEQIAKNTKIPGFRPGKAPKEMLKQKYRASVLGEAIDEIINENVDKIIKDNKLRPAMQPNVKLDKFEDGKDISFEVTVELMPEIKLGDFSKIKVEKLTADVPEEEIKKALDYIAQARRETVKIEDAAHKSAKGETVVIDFTGSVDGKEFNGGKGKDYHLELGSNTFIPGFEDQLIGVKAGDKVDVKVKFPENYHAKDLAGKDAVFAVEVKEIHQAKEVVFDDEFAKSVGAKDLATLKEDIKKRISNDYENASKLKLKRELLDKLDELYTFDVPTGLTDIEFKNISEQYQQAKKQNQLDEHEKNTPEEELMDEYKKIATRRVKLGLLLSEVGEEAKIQITSEDINAAIMKEAQKYPGQEKVVFDYYLKNKQAVEALKAPVMEEKLIDYVLSKTEIVEKKVSVEELYNFEEK